MLTHSKISDTDYRLTRNDRYVGRVRKEADCFSIVDGEAENLVSKLSYPTMAALKEAVADAIDPTHFAKPSIAHRPNLTGVRLQGGYSHSSLAGALRDAVKIWPERARDKNWLNWYLVRRHHEMAARFPYGSHSRRWLSENTTQGTYDHAEFIRRVEALYGPQPKDTY